MNSEQIKAPVAREVKPAVSPVEEYYHHDLCIFRGKTDRANKFLVHQVIGKLLVDGTQRLRTVTASASSKGYPREHSRLRPYWVRIGDEYFYNGEHCRVVLVVPSSDPEPRSFPDIMVKTLEVNRSTEYRITHQEQLQLVPTRRYVRKR